MKKANRQSRFAWMSLCGEWDSVWDRPHPTLARIRLVRDKDSAFFKHQTVVSGMGQNQCSSNLVPELPTE